MKRSLFFALLAVALAAWHNVAEASAQTPIPEPHSAIDEIICGFSSNHGGDSNDKAIHSPAEKALGGMDSVTCLLAHSRNCLHFSSGTGCCMKEGVDSSTEQNFTSIYTALGSNSSSYILGDAGVELISSNFTSMLKGRYTGPDPRPPAL